MIAFGCEHLLQGAQGQVGQALCPMHSAGCFDKQLALSCKDCVKLVLPRIALICLFNIIFSISICRRL